MTILPIRNDACGVDALQTAHDLLATYQVKAEVLRLERIERSLRHRIASADKPDEMKGILSRPRPERELPVRKEKPPTTKELPPV